MVGKRQIGNDGHKHNAIGIFASVTICFSFKPILAGKYLFMSDPDHRSCRDTRSDRW